MCTLATAKRKKVGTVDFGERRRGESGSLHSSGCQSTDSVNCA